MKYYKIVTFLALLIFSSTALSEGLKTTPSVAGNLQEISVTLNTGRAEGSGVIVKRGEYNYVLTAAHVVAGLRKTRSVIDPFSGTEKKIIEFNDAKIIQVMYEDAIKVGQVEMLAKVLCYSNADDGEDLAVLMVHKKNFINASASFYLDDNIPSAGTDLFHVGSLQGQLGSNSITTGIVSRVGRIFNNKLYDQTSCTAFPGSSGGGIFLKSDGRYVGMLTRGSGETFNLMIPIRRIKKWTDRMGLTFVLDGSIPVPTAEDFKKIPIEDTGKLFSNKNKNTTTQSSK